MNDIAIFPREIIKPVRYEGIQFSSCTFIEILIDGVSITEIGDFESGVVVWEQLKESTRAPGEYLLFTCYCGIPEDAGWDYIYVEHISDKIVWELDRAGHRRFEFDMVELKEQIKSCEVQLNLKQYPLAVPVSVPPHY